MSKDEKTLVILTPGFAKDEADSTCLPLQQQLLIALQEINPLLNIIVLSFQYPFRTEKYPWFNTTVIPFDGRSKGGIPRLLLRRKLMACLEKIHGETPITGLLSFWYGECAAVGKLFAGKHGLKHFCWILGQDAKKENKYPRRSQLPAGELIALSDFLRSEFEKNHGLSPSHVIPAGINTRLFDSSIKTKDIDIIGTGSLIRLKQYDLFLEVVAEIKKQMPGIRSVLVGKGPEKESLLLLITKLGLQSNVILAGELPYTEVLDYMQRAKIFLHPSSFEGFSGACLEALYAGAHVISFCKAMDLEIEQWHIVKSKIEMREKAMTILAAVPARNKKVLLYTIEDVAKKMTGLLLQSY